MAHPGFKLSRQQIVDIGVLLQLRVNALRDANRPCHAEELGRAERAIQVIDAWLDRTGYPNIIEPSNLETLLADQEAGR